MLESLEGKRGVIRAKPPIPALEGLFGKPTVVNNVLTLATVPMILADGGAAYAELGVGRSRGTQVFQLGRQHRARRHRRDGVRHHPGRAGRGLRRRHAHPGARCAPSRSAGRSAPTCRPSSSTCRWTTRRSPRPARWSATAASWSSTTPSTWRGRPGSRWSSAPRSRAASARRAGSARCAASRSSTGSSPARTATQNLVLLDDLCELMTDGSLCAMGGLTPMPVRSALQHFPEDFASPASHRRRRPVELRPHRTRLHPHTQHDRRRSRHDLLKEPDLGTPDAGTATVEVEVDGQPVSVPEGTSVMRAAALAGIDVPKLCATDSLEPFGSCRLCLVEVDGGKGTPASCTTPVRRRHEGHAPRSPKLDEAAPRRDGALHLRPPAGLPDLPGQRRLRAAGHGRRRRPARGPLRLRRARTTSTRRRTLSNPYFDFDASKCIVCSRCVRACDEVQGTFALTIAGRGFDSKVSRGAGESFMDSECVSCGACVQACPTSTLQEKLGHRARHADPDGPHHLRLLRRRLLVQGRAARRRGRADGARTRTAAPTRATRASRAASRSATPATPTGCSKPMIRETITDDVARGRVGRGDRLRRAPVHARSRTEHGVGRDRRHHLVAHARTKRSTSSRRWCAPPSATTTSTPAPGSATRPPATGSSRRSAPPPAPRTSSRSTRPT